MTRSVSQFVIVVADTPHITASCSRRMPCFFRCWAMERPNVCGRYWSMSVGCIVVPVFNQIWTSVPSIGREQRGLTGKLAQVILTFHGYGRHPPRWADQGVP